MASVHANSVYSQEVVAISSSFNPNLILTWFRGMSQGARFPSLPRHRLRIRAYLHPAAAVFAGWPAAVATLKSKREASQSEPIAVNSKAFASVLLAAVDLLHRHGEPRNSQNR